MKASLLRFAAGALVLGAALASPAPAQGVGTKVPEIELQGFSQTNAQSFEDYAGRAVLLEFFAYT